LAPTLLSFLRNNINPDVGIYIPYVYHVVGWCVNSTILIIL